MQIKKLILKNAFQHGSLEIPFSPFTSIIGQNGSGKSNIVESIGFLLSGRFTLPGTQDSMVKEGEEEGSITGVLEHEGEEITVVAKLGKSSRSLKRKDLKLGKAAEVMDYLANVVLKTPVDVVNTSTIIRQGGLIEGLFDSQAKRTESFMRMAGLSDIEKKRQALADARAAVTIPMLSFSVGESEKKLAELKDYAAKATQERAEIPAFDKLEIEKAQALVTLTDQAELLKETFGKLTKELSDARTAEAAAKQALDAQRAAVQALEAQEASQRQAAISASAELKNIAQQQKNWAAKQAAEKELAEIGAASSSLKEVPSEYAGEDPQLLSDTLTTINITVDMMKKTIDAFSGEVSQCPTCRRSCTVEEARKIVLDATVELEEVMRIRVEAADTLKAAVARKAEWAAALSEYQTALQALLNRLQLAESKLELVKDATAPAPAGTAKSVQDQYDKLSSNLKSAKKTLSEFERIHADALKLVSEVEVKLAKAGNPAESGVTKSSLAYLGAKSVLEKWEASKKRITELETIIAETSKRLADEQARLDKLRADVERSKTLVAFTDHLEFARTALHRDSFPSGKVKSFVDRMLINANMYLDAMNAGFSVTYSNEIGFSAYFPGANKSMRADRLSGGEKVTFALAFRFAVNELHTDTGFLILDEPTVWLDDAHIDYVINALALVKSKIVPRVQLIIVTHDEKLAAVADTVFEVKKG